MSEELKSTQIYYGENVLMMRVNDCLIFGNKDALRRLAKKLEERTAKVKNIAHVRGYPAEGTCGNCGFDVEDNGEYCAGCGAKLDWSGNE